MVGMLALGVVDRSSLDRVKPMTITLVCSTKEKEQRLGWLGIMIMCRVSDMSIL
jgi:hypothetical protein